MPKSRTRAEGRPGLSILAAMLLASALSFVAFRTLDTFWPALDAPPGRQAQWSPIPSDRRGNQTQQFPVNAD